LLNVSNFGFVGILAGSPRNTFISPPPLVYVLLNVSTFAHASNFLRGLLNIYDLNWKIFCFSKNVKNQIAFLIFTDFSLLSFDVLILVLKCFLNV
jgi:hypothetical protein